jgi:hypothetical protein
MEIISKSPVGIGVSSKGTLRLLISGFSQQQVVNVSQIVAAIDLLPNHHIEGLREIVYAPFGLPGDLLDAYSVRPPGQRKGEFRQKERCIVLYEIESLDLLFHVLYHEIGHFVFFLALNSRVKKRWVTEIFPKSQCITSYGASNASEDFAETYACYVRDPDRLQLLPAKFAFMRDWVFSGRVETLKEKNRASSR